MAIDWEIPYLQAARQKKILDIQNAQAAADQQAFENQLALDKLAISSSKSYRSGRRSGGSRGNSGNGGNGGGDDGNPDNNPFGGNGGGGAATTQTSYYTSLSSQLENILDKGYTMATANKRQIS